MTLTPRSRRFRSASHIDSPTIHGLAEQHPRLREFYRTLVRHSREGDARARSLFEHIIRRMIDDVGEIHLGSLTERLGRIEQLRDNIAVILDHVLEGGELPPGVNVERLGEYFDHLQHEMRDLTHPRDALIGNGEFRLTDEASDYARTLLNEFDTVHGGHSTQGVHQEPVERMLARFRELPPQQQAVLRRAAELHPDSLWHIVAADEARQQAGIANLREQLRGQLSETDLTNLEEAIGQLSRVRTRGLIVGEGQLGNALARIADARLRAIVEQGDPWIVQTLAVISPEQLQEMWARFRNRGGNNAAEFRAYLRHEITTYVRSVFGESTAASSLPEMEFFLKGPDRNTRQKGTDLVGIDHEGWVWVVDDKSHRATTVSSVTALFDHLVSNLQDDFRQFRDDLLRLQQAVPGFKPDPRVSDAIGHIGAAGREIQMYLESLPPDQRLNQQPSPATLAHIRGILDHHRIRLRVTSAFGEVTQISADLARIGIRVSPTGSRVRLSPLKP